MRVRHFLLTMSECECNDDKIKVLNALKKLARLIVPTSKSLQHRIKIKSRGTSETFSVTLTLIYFPLSVTMSADHTL